MSTEQGDSSTGLISVTNLSSKALIPSQLYATGLEEWGKAMGNHLYLIAIGPRANILSATAEADKWKISTEYYRDHWRPRTLRLPAGAFRSDDVSVSDGVLVHHNGGEEERFTAVQLARKALDAGRDDNSVVARSWRKHTIENLFDYSVVYRPSLRPEGPQIGRQAPR